MLFPAGHICTQCLSQLAKRKADELEDFNTGAFFYCFRSSTLIRVIDNSELEAGLSVEEIEGGNKIIEQLLRTWTSRLSAQDVEDVNMDVDESPESQVEELKKCVERFKPQIEGNAWVQRVLASLS